MNEWVNAIKAVQDRENVFGREFRLRNRSQFDIMRASGAKHVGKFCIIVMLKTPPDDSRRVAFLISRKYSLLAVDRNRARRLFRECYRLCVENLHGVWLLFIPRQRMKNAQLKDVLNEMTAVLLAENLLQKTAE